MTRFHSLVWFLWVVSARASLNATCDNSDETAYMQLRFGSGAECAGDGEDCRHSKCCKHAGHKCYKKNQHWAACMPSCTPGMIHPHDPDHLKTPWECTHLSHDECAGDGEDCRHSKCCKNAHHQCYKKNKHWAACLPSCTPGMIHPHDADEHKTPWECTPLHKGCAGDGEDCRQSGCCKNHDHKCYKKNEHWAGCMSSCTPGMIHPHDPDHLKTPWECTPVHGHHGHHGHHECAGDGQNCTHSKCCKKAHDHCYSKNEHWAACMSSCTPGMIHPDDPDEHKTPWQCKILSDPGHWHPNCAAEGSENCMHKGCCRRPGDTCYEKNQHWAACMPSCTPGMIPHWDHSDHKTPWSCKVLSGCVYENQDCRQSRCCKNPMDKCYEKNEHWAHCKSSCTPGINPHDPPEHQTPWTCKVLDPN